MPRKSTPRRYAPPLPGLLHGFSRTDGDEAFVHKDGDLRLAWVGVDWDRRYTGKGAKMLRWENLHFMGGYNFYSTHRAAMAAMAAALVGGTKPGGTAAFRGDKPAADRWEAEVRRGGLRTRRRERTIMGTTDFMVDAAQPLTIAGAFDVRRLVEGWDVDDLAALGLSEDMTLLELLEYANDEERSPFEARGLAYGYPVETTTSEQLWPDAYYERKHEE